MEADSILSLQKKCAAVLYDNIPNERDTASLSILYHLKTFDLCCIQAHRRDAVFKLSLKQFLSFDEEDIKEYVITKFTLDTWQAKFVNFCENGRNILSSWSSIQRLDIPNEMSFDLLELPAM